MGKSILTKVQWRPKVSSWKKRRVSDKNFLWFLNREDQYLWYIHFRNQFLTSSVAQDLDHLVNLRTNARRLEGAYMKVSLYWHWKMLCTLKMVSLLSSPRSRSKLIPSKSYYSPCNIWQVKSTALGSACSL